MKLKAYMAYPSKSPHDFGCLLVFAFTRNQARLHAIENWINSVDYIDMMAVRVPRWDVFARGDEPYSIETNEDLPAGVPNFYDDEDIE